MICRATFLTAIQLTPQARCQDVLLQANANCLATPSPADLIAAIDAGSTPGIGGTLSISLTPSPSPPGSTTYTLTPAVYTFQLTAANGAGASTCSAFVTVQTQKPRALCAPTLALPATAECAAHPSSDGLLAAINAGSTPGSGSLTLSLSPLAPAGGYSLPVGTLPFELVATTCAGTDTCSTLVTVSDQEPLDVSLVPPLRALNHVGLLPNALLYGHPYVSAIVACIMIRRPYCQRIPFNIF